MPIRVPRILRYTVSRVLETPIGTDTYIKEYAAQSWIKIVRNVEKLDSIVGGSHVTLTGHARAGMGHRS